MTLSKNSAGPSISEVLRMPAAISKRGEVEPRNMNEILLLFQKIEKQYEIRDHSLFFPEHDS